MKKGALLLHACVEIYYVTSEKKEWRIKEGGKKRKGDVLDFASNNENVTVIGRKSFIQKKPIKVSYNIFLLFLSSKSIKIFL